MREDGSPDSDEPLDGGERFALLYNELRRLAESYMRRQRSSHTLQPTALVHEAFLKLGDLSGVTSMEHFKASAARAMKQILIDHARGKNRKKRSADGVQVPLDSIIVQYENRAVNLIDLDDALKRYTQLGPKEAQGAQIVDLKFFGGLTMKDISVVLGMSLRTAEREYKNARAWLFIALGGADEEQTG